MVRVPIPRSWGRYVMQVLSGSLIDVLWKLSVIVVGIALVVLVTIGGPPAWITSVMLGIALGYALDRPIHQTVLDIYHRRFLRV